MSEIKIKARIQNKYYPLEKWNKLIKGEFIQLSGEVCYAVDNNMLYQKIGDGKTDFTDLVWLVSQAACFQTLKETRKYDIEKLEQFADFSVYIN